MNLGHKRTLIVAVALSTFFAATLSYSRQKTRFNQRVMTETPQKADETKSEAKTVTTNEDKKLACRTGALVVGTRYTEETLWASNGKSEIPVGLIKSGTQAVVNCTAAVPHLKTDANLDVTGGTLTIQCDDGVLKVVKTECVGKTLAMLKAEQEEAARIEAARVAEEQRLAAIKAEEDRIAREQAAAAAAAAAQAAAAAAAAAGCPQNCNGATGTLRGGNSGKGGGNGQWTVNYQQCNNGQKIVRSSGTSSYATGACYNSIPR